MRIAVIGCGVGGMAAALFLNRRGHDVSIFERFEEPKPLGAGLTLQPTGLHVLRALGLEEAILSCGARLSQLYGDTPSGRAVMDLRYADHRPDAYGVGIQRGALFGVLHAAVLDAGIPVRAGTEILRLSQAPENVILEWDGGTEAVDLAIVANGSDSLLRPSAGRVRRDKRYGWGALWGLVPKPEGWDMSVLLNRYKGPGVMIGALPVGHLPGESRADDKITLFWSLRARDAEHWRAQPFEGWKAGLLTLWPVMEPLLEGLSEHDDLSFARYRDAVARPVRQGRTVLIGDAAHAMSPQLGQGANMALIDAMVLAEELSDAEAPEPAFARYEARRRPHWRYYQFASRWLTPLFQSNLPLAGLARDIGFPLSRRIGVTRRLTARTLCGEVFSGRSIRA